MLHAVASISASPHAARQVVHLGFENVEHAPARNSPAAQEEVQVVHCSVLLTDCPVHVLLGAYEPAGHVQSTQLVVSEEVVPLHGLAMYCPLAQPCLAQSAQTRSEVVVPEHGTRMYCPLPADEHDVLQLVHCPS